MHVGAHKSTATNCFEVATGTPETHMTIAAIVTKGAHFACKYESSLKQLNSHKEKLWTSIYRRTRLLLGALSDLLVMFVF
jgi:hypothetical protein